MRGDGGAVVPKGAGASGALVIVLEASGKSLLGALHLTTFRGSGVQFLVILCFPGIKEAAN